MLLSKAEASGWVIALVIVGVMAFVVFHGPFKYVNKVHASAYPTMQVKIVSNVTDGGQYVPAKFTIHVGQKVTFTNISNAQHTVTEVNDLFDSGDLGTGGGHWTWTASKKGAFSYGCAYHPRMKGTITVIG